MSSININPPKNERMCTYKWTQKGKQEEEEQKKNVRMTIVKRNLN